MRRINKSSADLSKLSAYKPPWRFALGPAKFSKGPTGWKGATRQRPLMQRSEKLRVHPVGVFRLRLPPANAAGPFLGDRRLLSSAMRSGSSAQIRSSCSHSAAFCHGSIIVGPINARWFGGSRIISLRRFVFRRFDHHIGVRQVDGCSSPFPSILGGVVAGYFTQCSRMIRGAHRVDTYRLL
jgi:hypothetical protein